MSRPSKHVCGAPPYRTVPYCTAGCRYDELQRHVMPGALSVVVYGGQTQPGTGGGGGKGGGAAAGFSGGLILGGGGGGRAAGRGGGGARGGGAAAAAAAAAGGGGPDKDGHYSIATSMVREAVLVSWCADVGVCGVVQGVMADCRLSASVPMPSR